MLSFLLTNSMFPYDFKINFYHTKPTSTLKKLKIQKRPCHFCGKAFAFSLFFGIYFLLFVVFFGFDFDFLLSFWMFYNFILHFPKKTLSNEKHSFYIMQYKNLKQIFKCKFKIA